MTDPETVPADGERHLIQVLDEMKTLGQAAESLRRKLWDEAPSDELRRLFPSGRSSDSSDRAAMKKLSDRVGTTVEFERFERGESGRDN